MTYPIKLTRLAAAMAQAKYTLESVEQMARQELDSMDINPANIIFHCFRMTKETDHEFICRSDEEGKGIIVDTCTYETGEPLETGPMKGKRFETPVPDSDDR